MSTVRFCGMLGLPERTYRRWQQREREGRPARGPWPTPAQDRVAPAAIAVADRWSEWGSRTVAMFLREDHGIDVCDSTVYRALKRAGRVLEVDHLQVRREHAQARRAAFLVAPTAPLQVWQMDFSEFETRWGGTWRIGGCADYWSKLELGWHVSPTNNHRDAISAVRLAIAEAERLLDGQSLLEHLTDPATGDVRPICLVSDNGPCFKSRDFARFIASRPELVHIRTRVKSPGQNGVRERGFRSLKYQHLYRVDIDDGHQLGLEVERYRTVYNTIRPHHALAGKRPIHVHQNPDLHPDRAHPTTAKETILTPSLTTR